MRYSIHGNDTNQIQQDVLSVQGTNINILKITKQVFVDLTPDAARSLATKGYIVSSIQQVSTHQVTPPTPEPGTPTYTPQDLFDLMQLGELRNLTDPPVDGQGFKIAVIDSGMRESHALINNAVINSKHFAGNSPDDVFNHGTGVGSIIVSMAPGVKLINIRVLGDDGQGRRRCCNGIRVRSESKTRTSRSGSRHNQLKHR